MAEVVPEKPRISILNQSETQAHLYRLINEAERYIFLISPYVRFDKLRTLVRHVQGALTKGVKVKLVVREKDFSTGNDDVLTSDSLPPLRQAGLEVLVLKDLHAKIYLSEKFALLTSLNLLESSFNNSIEIGTWIPAGTPEYEAVAAFLRTEVQPTASKVTALPSPPVLAPPPKRREAKPNGREREESAPSGSFTLTFYEEDAGEGEDSSDEGHCIRCGDDLGFNLDKPLCRDCYGVWKQYRDEDYPEKFCHSCGESRKTTMAKPVCRPCFSGLD